MTLTIPFDGRRRGARRGRPAPARRGAARRHRGAHRRRRVRRPVPRPGVGPGRRAGRRPRHRGVRHADGLRRRCPLPVGVSIGITLCTEGDTPESALAAADARMYQVKAGRRSRGRGRLAAVPQR